MVPMTSGHFDAIVIGAGHNGLVTAAYLQRGGMKTLLLEARPAVGGTASSEEFGGAIVNIASVAGKEGNPNASAYAAAKAGVIGLTKSLGKELADTNIRVNGSTPAVIETEILEQCTQAHIDYMVSKIPMGRVGQVTEVAAMIAWLSSDEVSFSTGAVFDISGGRATY